MEGGTLAGRPWPRGNVQHDREPDLTPEIGSRGRSKRAKPPGPVIRSVSFHHTRILSAPCRKLSVVGVGTMYPTSYFISSTVVGLLVRDSWFRV